MDNTCDLGGNLMTHESVDVDPSLMLIKALVLAVTAPLDSQSKECIKIAKGIANGMKKSDVEYCKKKAKQQIKQQMQAATLTD